MSELFDVLEALLREHAPAVVRGLRPPASLSEIEAFELELGRPLPADLREAYLWHNGQDYGDPKNGYLLTGFAWIGLGDVLRLWRMNNKILASMDPEARQDDASITDDQKVRYEWWNAAWVPIGDMKAGDALCVDLAPGPAGRTGQLCLWAPDCGDGPVVFADGFGAHLQRMTALMQQGALAYSESTRCWTNPFDGRERDILDIWLRQSRD